MSTPSESTYGNLQMEERYKKLERTLKMLVLKQKKSLIIKSPDPRWPNISSINGDLSDTSCTGISVHSSCASSDVLASSGNLQRTIPSVSQFPRSPFSLTTSSVKRFANKCVQAEQLLMPPPGHVGIAAHSSRKTSFTSSSFVKPQRPSGTDQGFSTQSAISSRKRSSLESRSKTEFEKENCRSHKEALDINPDRIFTRWRPVLNNKGILIIKGTLDCGKIVRSKPVIRKLSSNAVQSVFNHIYHLKGNIYDERNELPEYIRGKFYNGFPDDWENVYQIWSNFIATGSCPNFRWPTPITDSDDDLNSEITEVSDVHISERCVNSGSNFHIPKVMRLNVQNDLVSNNGGRQEFSEEIPGGNNSFISRKHLCKYRNDQKNHFSDSLHHQNRLLNDERRVNSSRIPGQYMQDELKIPFGPGRSRDHEIENSHGNVHNFVELGNPHMHSSSVSLKTSIVNRLAMASLKDIIQEDKLNIILENLKSNKCSVQYLNKMLEMFDCLKYVMSYESDNKVCNHSCQSPHLCKVHCVDRESAKCIASFQGSPQDSLRSVENGRYPEVNVKENEDRARSLIKTLSTSQPNSMHSVPKHYRTPQKFFKMPGQALVRYDSCVSLSEAEPRPLKPTLDVVKSRKRFLGLQAECCDSSVSLTEDEFSDNFHGSAETKRQILQDVIAKVVKPSEDFITLSYFKRTHGDDPPTISEKRTGKANYLNKDEEIELNLSDATLKLGRGITEQSAQRRSPDTLKTKPCIVNITKVSAVLPPQHHIQSSSQMSHNDHNLSTKYPHDFTNSVFTGIRDENLQAKWEDLLKDKESKRVPLLKSIKDSKKAKYGTVSNPKVLTTWVPKLLSKPGGNYGLVFEGILLNEARHVTCRKFSTDFIFRRVNSKVVETDTNEFYHLSGDLSDVKHTLPREVQKMCLKGCPARINILCEKWRNLIKDQDLEMNVAIAVPMSSRGRRILPPLCYWTGERVALKDNTPVYSPGNTPESSVPSSLEMSFRKEGSQNSPSRRNTSGKKTGANDTSHSGTLNTISVKKRTSLRKEKVEQRTKNNATSEDIPSKLKKNPESDFVKKLRSSSKRRLSQEVEDDSTEFNDVEMDLRVKRRRARRGINNSPMQGRKVQKSHSECTINKDRRARRREDMQGQSSKLTCAYQINVPYCDDVLSDDQLSTI